MMQTAGLPRLRVPAIAGKNVIEHAQALTAAGFQLVLVHAPLPGGGCSCKREGCTAVGKHPMGRMWQKRPLKSPEEARDAIQQCSFTPNLGLLLGQQPGGAYVIAIDDDDHERFLKLEEDYGPLPETVVIRSARGTKLLFTIPDETPRDRLKNVTGLGGIPGVDIKVAGGQIVIHPSIHATGSLYECERAGEIAELPPNWTLAILDKPKTPEWAATYTPQTMKEDVRAQKRAEKYLQSAVLGESNLLARTGKGLRNTTLHLAACRLFALAHGISLMSGHAYVARELQNAARAAGLPHREIVGTIASAEKWVQESGAQRMPFVTQTATTMPPPAPDSEPQSYTPGDPDSIKLILENNSPAKIAENVIKLLLEHQDWRGGPILDSFGMNIKWPQPLPEPLGKAFRHHDNELIGEDSVYVQGWLMSQPFTQRVKVGLDTVTQAIIAAARRNSFDSLKHVVGNLPAWDRVHRLDTWLHRYFGAENTQVNQRIGRAWMISCIARAHEPGCVADGMLVLEGLEAAGKNRAIEILFGGHPWVGSLGSYKIGRDREADRIAGECWVLHIDELSGLSAGSKEEIKSWLSRKIDPYRLPYDRSLVHIRRRCVALGSTNAIKYLEDDQNRRFWPVRCGHKRGKSYVVDFEAIEKDRLQLFAEAKAAYLADEKWTIGRQDSVWEKLVEEQKSRAYDDMLTTSVESALRSPEVAVQVTLDGIADWIARNTLAPPEKRDKKYDHRLCSILHSLGWEREIYWDRDKTRRRWIRAQTI